MKELTTKQRKQYIVKLPNEIKGNKFIKSLENKGFNNVHKISFESLRIKVLVIGKNEFFSTNAICLAALSRCGIKPISIEDFISEINLNKEQELPM